MRSSRPNHIAEIRKARGLSQQQLAEAVDAHWVTISRLERGQLQLNEAWLSKLSKALEVNLSALVNWFPDRTSIHIAGEIQKGNRLKEHKSPTDGFLPILPGSEFVDSWIEVADSALWPHFQEGDLIRFIRFESGAIDKCIGRLCIVYARNGSTTHFGFLERGGGPTSLNIRPFSGPPVEDLNVKQIRVAVEVRYAIRWPLADGL